MKPLPTRKTSAVLVTLSFLACGEGPCEGSAQAADSCTFRETALTSRDGGPDGSRQEDSESKDDFLPDGCVRKTCSGFAQEHFSPLTCACEPCARTDECTDGKACLDGVGCVECTNDDTSGCKAQGKVCSSAGTNTCVECNESSDCRDPSRPVCNDHACEPCTQDSECAMRDLICVEAGTLKGQCVACTADATDELRCGEYSCNPATNSCTNHKRGSVRICEPCFADSECEANHACIPLYFGTDKELLGGYCMKLKSSGCTPPYGALPIRRASMHGAAEAEYCGIDEAVTSCAAIQRLEAASSCAGDDASLCAARGARCESVNDEEALCTYACTSSDTCPSGFPCGGPQGARHCGGA